MRRDLSGSSAGSDGQIEQQVAFSGTASAYFGIWIVNLILSIITLGIYSAWAKVRRETFFKNHTKIIGTGFGYHATGWQILKGRLIAFAALVVINIVASIHPLAGLVFVPIFIFLTPWLLNSSIRFAARMTSFRNVRFNWHGTYWRTMWFLVIAPIFGLLTLGLLTPLISKSYYAYFASSHSYGTTRFSAKPKVSEFYLAFLVGGILPTLILSCIFFTILTIGPLLGGSHAAGLSALWTSLVVAIYIFIFAMSFIYRVLCRNILMRSLALSDVATFGSKISPVKFVWISLSNLVAVVLSIGLLLPWAKVRLYRYLANSTEIRITGDIETFIDDAASSRSSFGEEFAEFEGIEVTI